MPQYPNLNNAPIAEAIFSVEVVPTKQCDMNCLKDVCAQLSSVYTSEPEEWLSIEGAFTIKDGGVSTSHTSEKIGYIIKSPDEKSILHVGKNSLVLNKLKPYTNWQDLSAQFEDAWNIYVKSVMPNAVNRIGVRYINNFEIPIEKWNENLLMYPVMNTGNQLDSSSISMGDVFSRYGLKSDRYVAESIVMLHIKVNNLNNLSIIMDIDVKSVDKITNYSGYHEIKDVADRLRDFKNQIFFSNVPNAEELFR